MGGRNTDMAKLIEETTQSQEEDSSLTNPRISGGSRNKNKAICSQIYIYFVCFQIVSKKWLSIKSLPFPQVLVPILAFLHNSL